MRIMKYYGNFWNLFFISITFLFISTLFIAQGFCQNSAVNLYKSKQLRYRCYFMPVHPQKGLTSYTVNVNVDDYLLPNEGVSIKKRDWATAVDLMKSVLEESKYIRVIENPLAASNVVLDGRDNADFVLIAKFGVGKDGYSVFLRLIDIPSGSCKMSADAIASKMKIAIEAAVAKIEHDLFAKPWHCRVKTASKDSMIIARGELDGIIVGQEFIGYSLGSDAARKSKSPIEMLILQYGKHQGIYRVVMTQGDFSKIVSVNKSPVLYAGDIIEMPAVIIREKNERTKGKSVWDRVYNK